MRPRQDPSLVHEVAHAELRPTGEAMTGTAEHAQPVDEQRLDAQPLAVALVPRNADDGIDDRGDCEQASSRFSAAMVKPGRVPCYSRMQDGPGGR